jgi:hypothetical protein
MSAAAGSGPGAGAAAAGAGAGAGAGVSPITVIPTGLPPDVSGQAVPKIARYSPWRVALVKGNRYSWCSCGHSVNVCMGPSHTTAHALAHARLCRPLTMSCCCACEQQPWCNNVCLLLATPISRVDFVANQNATVNLCGCKQTTTAPLCTSRDRSIPRSSSPESTDPSMSMGDGARVRARAREQAAARIRSH